MNLNKAVALRISELCREKNITLYRLAMNSGIPHSTIKNIMHETNKDNLISTIFLLSYGFEIQPWEFIKSPLFEREKLDL